MIAHVALPTVFLAVLLIGALICIFCLNKLRSSAEQTFQKELNSQKWRADLCGSILDLIGESQRPWSTSMSGRLQTYDELCAKDRGGCKGIPFVGGNDELRIRHQVRAREAERQLQELEHALRELLRKTFVYDEKSHRDTITRIQCELGAQDHSVIVAASTAYVNMRRHLYEGNWTLESIGTTEETLGGTLETIVRYALKLCEQQEKDIRAERLRMEQDVVSLQTCSGVSLVHLLPSETKPDAQEPAVSVSAETATS